MSIVKTALIVLGGTGLFAGSFLGFSVATGHSLKDIPLLHKFAKDTPPPMDISVHPAETEPTPTEEAPPSTTKTPAVAKASATASVLGAFVLPAPFSSDELAD